MNKKGFTLIELLAVIIILGILMIIAIPSVTKYISDSRKNSYVDTAKEVIGSARNLVNSGELEMYDTDATYYIDVNCIKTENAMKSPYGDFTNAYVVVTYDGKGYDYFWTSVDDAGQGVKNIVKYDKLDTDDISSDLTIDDISTLRTLDGRGKVILITERNSCKKEGAITENLIPVNSEAGEEGGSSGGGSSSNAVVYPTGKTKDTVVVGDIVTIDTEEFYVVSNDGTDLVLLAHYNLNVGSNKKSDETEGLQSENVVGYKSGKLKYGNIAFSSTYYWSSSTYPKDITLEGSYVKEYVDAYKSALEEMGATIKEARLLKYSEAEALGCVGSSNNCNNAPEFVLETSYWLGTAFDNYDLWRVSSGNMFYGSSYSAGESFGVRPVIVI